MLSAVRSYNARPGGDTTMNTFRRRATARLAAACVIALATPFGVSAQGYPTKPIRLIVPFAPGGNVDITARTIAPALGEALGQPIVVENRPGAGGLIGAEAVVKSAPDGYTLLMGSNSTVSVAPALYPKAPYNPVRDFAPVTILATVPFVLVVHPSVPAKSVAELVALAKARPDYLSLASAGTGTSNHLVAELFEMRIGARMTHIPYKGAGPAVADLTAGQVNVMFDQLTSSMANIRGGKLRALAVTSPARSPGLPDVPTFAEAGVRDFELANITGIVAPAGTPPEVVAKLRDAAVKVLGLPVVKERFASLGVDPVGSTPAQFAAFIREDFARWQKVIADANVKVE
jgi:tripartite-type tricarboxylate transporter receptor subunit TctC